MTLSEIADMNYRHCVVFCKLSPREVFSIQKYLSSKLIAFLMRFYYGEEVLDQNFSSVLDNVLIHCVSMQLLPCTKYTQPTFFDTQRQEEGCRLVDEAIGQSPTIGPFIARHEEDGMGLEDMEE